MSNDGCHKCSQIVDQWKGLKETKFAIQKLSIHFRKNRGHGSILDIHKKKGVFFKVLYTFTDSSGCKLSKRNLRAYVTFSNHWILALVLHQKKSNLVNKVRSAHRERPPRTRLNPPPGLGAGYGPLCIHVCFKSGEQML